MEKDEQNKHFENKLIAYKFKSKKDITTQCH